MFVLKNCDFCLLRRVATFERSGASEYSDMLSQQLSLTLKFEEGNSDFKRDSKSLVGGIVVPPSNDGRGERALFGPTSTYLILEPGLLIDRKGVPATVSQLLVSSRAAPISVWSSN